MTSLGMSFTRSKYGYLDNNEWGSVEPAESLMVNLTSAQVARLPEVMMLTSSSSSSRVQDVRLAVMCVREGITKYASYN